MRQPGDDFLSDLADANTFDACVLELDFSCPAQLERVNINYVFASDEYPEFVNSGFNDASGFALDGENIAIVPGSGGLPVTIDNVNCVLGSEFCDLFIPNSENDGWPVNLQADGMTLMLTADGMLRPGQNTMRFAVDDAGDAVYDSWK